MAERVQKILANAGIASRRKCEDLIKDGRVTVNGRTVILGDTAERTDDIRVEGEPVVAEEKVYIMLNKPQDYVTTVSEGHGMKTVMDLIKTDKHVYPAGRLDVKAEGMLILSNDGEFVHKITHPSNKVKKTYYVEADREITDEAIEKIKKGTKLEDKTVKADCVRNEKGVNVIIAEGSKHIIRKLLGAHSYRVTKLVRIKTGNLELGDLKEGKWRLLTKKDIELIFS